CELVRHHLRPIAVAIEPASAVRIWQRRRLCEATTSSLRAASRLGPAVMHDNAGPIQRTMWRTNANIGFVNLCNQKFTLRPINILTDGGRGTRIGATFTRARALACVLLVSGCVANGPQPETRSEPVRTPAQMCHIDRALLMAVRAPDCGFGRADLK